MTDNAGQTGNVREPTGGQHTGQKGGPPFRGEPLCPNVRKGASTTTKKKEITTTAPTPDRERQRKCRERKRRGLVLARAEVPDRIVEALVEQGALAEDEATDARAIGEALVAVTEKSVTV